MPRVIRAVTRSPGLPGPRTDFLLIAHQEQFARQIPLGNFGDPSHMADLGAFLRSPNAGYITSERIHVDGGLARAY